MPVPALPGSSQRDAVFDALVDLLKAQVPGIKGQMIKTYSRRMEMPANIAADDLPAIRVWEQDEVTVKTGFATPPKRTWEAWVVLVYKNPDKDVAGGTILNPILTQVENAVQDPDTDNQTLGGLVYSTNIEGDTLKNTGDTDPNGLGGFIVPVKMLVP